MGPILKTTLPSIRAPALKTLELHRWWPRDKMCAATMSYDEPTKKSRTATLVKHKM